MSGMSTHSQRGSINVLLIPLILAVLLLIGAASFGAWAFSSRQTYKNHSDELSATAANAAVQTTQVADAAKYAQEEKDPLKTFVGPAQYGSITVLYPKTWSGYVVENSSTPLNAYFQPNVVPDITDQDNTFALTLQVTSQTYAEVLQQYQGQAQTGQVTIQPYSLPKLPSVVGTRVDGQISQQDQGSVIILPLRNTTLIISTDTEQEESDLNNIILPNLSFSP